VVSSVSGKKRLMNVLEELCVHHFFDFHFSFDLEKEERETNLVFVMIDTAAFLTLSF